MAGQIDFVPTGAWELILHPQYVEEDDGYGITPLDGNVWQNCGVTTEIGMDVTIEEDVVRILGSRDIYNQLKLGVAYAFALRYKAQGTKNMRYGTELPARTPAPDHTMVAPNGTNFASRSIKLSAFIDDLEKWRLYKGTKVSTIAGAISRDAGIEITENYLCKAITEWTTEPAWTNDTDAGAISGNPWTGISMGPDPLDVAGTKIQCPVFNWSVDQGLGQIRPTGIDSVYYLGPTNRSITFDFQTWVKGNKQILDTVGHTAQLIKYLMNAGAELQIAGSKYNTYSHSIVTGSAEFSSESVSGTGKTFTVPSL
jgi:hypothetical protein